MDAVIHDVPLAAELQVMSNRGRSKELSLGFEANQVIATSGNPPIEGEAKVNDGR